jgi:hypothetical protein
VQNCLASTVTIPASCFRARTIDLLAICYTISIENQCTDGRLLTMPLPDDSEPPKSPPKESEQSLPELLAETASGGENPVEDDPVTRLKKRALGPIQKRIYHPINRMIDRLGYPVSVVLFVLVVGGGWLGLKLWSHPAEARKMLIVARYYLDARSPTTPRDAQTAEVIRQLTNQVKNDISPANRDNPNGSFSAWTQAQMVVSLQGEDIVDTKEMSHWFELQAEACNCWREVAIGPAHTGVTAWVLLAYARMGVKPGAEQVEFALKSQHKPGWWAMFPATDAPGNASTYATSLMVWALQELSQRDLIATEQKEAVATAVSRGRDWLLDNAIPGKPGRWNDYPNGVYGHESVSVSGLALHVLHKTPGQEPKVSDASWMANLPAELPMPKDENSSAQFVITLQNGPFADPTHLFLLPWLLIGTADAYGKGTVSQRAQAARLFHQIEDRSDVITHDLKDMPWLAAETLIGLRYLRGDDVI